MANFSRVIIFLIFIALSLKPALSQKVYPLSRNDSSLLTEYETAYNKELGLSHKKEASRYINLAAMLYWERNHFDAAETQFLNSLKINKELANSNGVTMINNNLAMIYADKKDYKKSLNYFEETLIARRVSKEPIGIISALINQSVVYNKLKEYKNAIVNLEEALDMAREMNDANQMKSCYGMLSETYEKAGDSKKSMYYYDYFKTFNDLVTDTKIKKSNDELRNEQLKRELAELEKRNKELELQKTEIKLKETEEEVKVYSKEQDELLRTLSKQEMSLKIVTQNSTIKDLENSTLKNEKKFQQQIIWYISIALLIIIGLSFFLFKLYKKISKFNSLLLAKNTEINQANEEILAQRDALESSNQIIEVKNRHITSSINYAKHIQTAMLNKRDQLTDYLPNSFIFYKPRDIVSGDFYWYYKRGNKTFVIVADCTGHGVPGAFISMIGNNLLNSIIIDLKIEKPSEILKRLDNRVVDALNQEFSENSDGMDIAICVINSDTDTLEYSGAKAPIVLMEDNKLTYVNPGKFSVGSILKSQKRKKEYINHTFEITKKDTSVYMFSDGYQDQFDSENRKKFSRKRLKSLIEEINQKPNKEEILNKSLKNWKGSIQQTDDITLLGFKIN